MSTQNNIIIKPLHNKKNKNTGSRTEYFKKEKVNPNKNIIYTNYNLVKNSSNIITSKEKKIRIINNDDVYEFISKNLLNTYNIFNLLLLLLKENMDKIKEVQKKIKNIKNPTRISRGTNMLRGKLGFKINNKMNKKIEYENVIQHLEHSKKNIINAFKKFINKDYDFIKNKIIDKLDEEVTKLSQPLPSSPTQPLPSSLTPNPNPISSTINSNKSKSQTLPSPVANLSATNPTPSTTSLVALNKKIENANNKKINPFNEYSNLKINNSKNPFKNFS
jgi:hypothetical protein